MSRKIVKVMRYQLKYIGDSPDFYSMQKELWQIQKDVREIKNRTIQMCVDWDFRNMENHRITGEWLDVFSETGYKRYDGYVYDRLKRDYDKIVSYTFLAAVEIAWKKYKSAKSDVLKGAISIPSYRSNQPIPINKKQIKVTDSLVSISIFSQKKCKESGYQKLKFEPMLKDGTQRAIWKKVVVGDYQIGESQIVYEKSKWFLLLTYMFQKPESMLDKNKILGVDMGVAYAMYASVFGDRQALKIDGGEITAFANKVEARVRSMQRQTAVCGEGRKGHGTKSKCSAIFDGKKKIANFRNTINHRYSRALVDYAVKNGCGTIQMENLTGIKDDVENSKFLKHWTYYDLQQKIKSKANEVGIEVILIDPRYTSQRCSKCGYIDSGNRTTQERFCCLKCGYKTNADYNASQNIAIAGIDELIRANKEQTKK